MTRRVQAAAATLALAALVFSGCGGGSKKAAEPLPKPPTLTVPGDTSTPSVPKQSSTSTNAATTTGTSTTATTTPTPTTSTPATAGGGAAAPQTGGTSAGGTTSSSPAAGSPQSKFEQFCKDNPGAC